jgi:DNA polymerase
MWVDFETRSECDLKTAGVYNYARHPSTSVLCMSYAYDDGLVQTWRLGEPMPPIKSQIRAHNAAFERLIFWHVLKMDIPLEQFYCTAAQARANCAPGSLEDVGRFAGTEMRKDHRGAALVRACCIPPYRDDLISELIEYCEQDVRTMRAASKAMRELTPEELEDYHVNERINDRGVLVDQRLCRAAVKYAADELQEIEAIVQEVTNGAIQSVRSPRMRRWVLERVGPVARDFMRKSEKQLGSIKPIEGMALQDNLYSIDKTVRANLLAIDDPEEVPPDVREVIQCADDLWASSVAKFNRLDSLACADGRVRGAFVFAGGSATGRASSYGAQVHNFTRKCADDPEAVRHSMVRSHAIVPRYGRRVTDVLRGMLRPALIPAPGKQFVVADWSAIEGRVNPWLSGRGEDKLQAFRDHLDPYVVNAASTFHVKYEQVDKSQRQVGKVQELACGFGGGVGAFAAMGRVYGLHLPEPEAKRMVDAWRQANPWSVPFWSDLEVAYIRALRNPGKIFEAGRVKYLADKQHLWYALPSGRVLCYPNARFEEDGSITYSKASWKPAADAKEWPRGRLWRGLACENVTQATAHDLLREALRRLPDVVLHVHDEIVLESDRPEEAKALLEEVMTTPPVWAKGLPLEVEATIMGRYGK